jgi:hypothetical protein
VYRLHSPDCSFLGYITHYRLRHPIFGATDSENWEATMQVSLVNYHWTGNVRLNKRPRTCRTDKNILHVFCGSSLRMNQGNDRRQIGRYQKLTYAN